MRTMIGTMAALAFALTAMAPNAAMAHGPTGKPNNSAKPCMMKASGKGCATSYGGGGGSGDNSTDYDPTLAPDAKGTPEQQQQACYGNCMTGKPSDYSMAPLCTSACQRGSK